MLWVIDPSLNSAEDQGTQELLTRWNGDHRLFRPVIDSNGPSVDDGYDFDAVILMGSAASVHDDFPWLQRLSAWLRPIVTGEIERPLLGICFGHQLLAHVAGGEVQWMSAEKLKRLGVENSSLRKSRLLGVEADELRVVVSHAEAVTTPPVGYRVTASRPGVPIDGIEHETLPLFSYQFHPEARDEFATRTGLGAEQIDERLCRDSQRLIDRFVELVSAQKKRAGRPSAGSHSG
jgi:GMP synthase (glutamine-hydrolysing)